MILKRGVIQLAEKKEEQNQQQQQQQKMGQRGNNEQDLFWLRRLMRCLTS